MVPVADILLTVWQGGCRPVAAPKAALFDALAADNRDGQLELSPVYFAMFVAQVEIRGNDLLQ